jgi:hypothetical protein
MAMRVALAALAASVLLASSPSGSGAQVQAITPSSDTQNAAQVGAAPQLPPRGGAPTPYPVGPTSRRLPGQDCRGLGACAWGGQSEQTGTCTSDARVCTGQGAGPNWPSITCTTTGSLRTCNCNSWTSVTPYSLPGTAGTSSPTPAGMPTSPNTLPNGSLQPGGSPSLNTPPNGALSMGNNGSNPNSSPTGLYSAC